MNKRRLIRYLNSFSGRLVAGILLLHLVLLPILLTRMLGLVEQGYSSQFVRYINADASLLANLMAATANKQKLSTYLDETVTSKRVVFASYKRTQTGEQIHAGQLPAVFQEDFSFGMHADDLYQIAVPVTEEEGNERAVLQLGYDERSIKKRILAAQRSVYVMMATYLLFMLLFAIFFSRHLGKSIVLLREASRQILAAGQVDNENERKLRINTSITEIRDLSLDLEHMRRRLFTQTEKLEFQAFHDALTRLPNRILLQDRVEQVIMASQRNKKTFAFLLLDLDKFKEVNDSLGHHAGDQLLCMLTSRFERSMRSMDTFARLSGDEFAILLTDSNEEQAFAVAKKVAKLMERPFSLGEHNLQVEVSIGVAMYPEHAEDYSGLLKCADIAMYDAKQQGHGFSAYRKTINHLSVIKIGLANEIRNALIHSELLLYYQPKISLKNNIVEAVEALVRWAHPTRGVLPPDEFIPIAEKSLLINDITNYILELAIHQSRQWQDQGVNWRVAVNLSVRNLSDEKLLVTIAGLLKKYQVPPERLELEVTESMIMQNPGHAKNILSKMIDMGIKVVIDDFGRGYTSLSQLVTLPVSAIKVDKSFVIEMLDSRFHRVIVKNVIDLALALDKTVVSEGVENAQTLDALKTMQSDEAQGYHICPPLPADQLDQWFKTTQYKSDAK